MLPTVGENAEIQLVDRLDPYNLNRGDIITIRAPYHKKRSILKRVVGLVSDILNVVLILLLKLRSRYIYPISY